MLYLINMVKVALSLQLELVVFYIGFIILSMNSTLSPDKLYLAYSS